ncbi:hypothetical protein AB0L53_09540 [Nonomuraea sp. NPDC052129]|uniref:hypothetical protein n=1 Tax=Nonomuraea sp. NPDC052129 TaxID=3154651 RepID=UPI003449BFE1
MTLEMVMFTDTVWLASPTGPSAAGAYIRGFDHEVVMSLYGSDGPRPRVLDSVPEVFRHCVEESAFCHEDGMPIRQRPDEAPVAEGDTAG